MQKRINYSKMKRLIFLVAIAVFCACDNEGEKEKEQEVMTTDQLPEGEWNGEYVEVKDTVAEKKKPKKKSKGSAYFSMGMVEVEADTMHFSIDLFDQKKNYVTISENSLMMRIKSAQRDFLVIQLKKSNIVGNYAGTYPIDRDGKKMPSSAIDFNRLASKNQLQLTMVSGSTELESFSPRLGKAVLQAKGTFEDASGNTFPGSVNVDMRFESVVSSYNPNS